MAKAAKKEKIPAKTSPSSWLIKNPEDGSLMWVEPVDAKEYSAIGWEIVDGRYSPAEKARDAEALKAQKEKETPPPPVDKLTAGKGSVGIGGVGGKPVAAADAASDEEEE